jgi:fucose permease
MRTASRRSVSAIFFLNGTVPAAVPRDTAPVFAPPGRALLGLGLLAFLGLLTEGAMADWTAVYLSHALMTSHAVASAGFAAFSLAMAAGRFGGDWLVGRFGCAAVLRTSASIAALGLGSALVLGQPGPAIVGFGLVGLGIANAIPILFSAAAAVPGLQPGRALAAVAAAGYLGFLAGPPLIGFVADLTSLPLGLAIVSACCALIAARGGRVASIGAGQRR